MADQITEKKVISKEQEFGLLQKVEKAKTLSLPRRVESYGFYPQMPRVPHLTIADAWKQFEIKPVLMTQREFQEYQAREFGFRHFQFADEIADWTPLPTSNSRRTFYYQRSPRDQMVFVLRGLTLAQGGNPQRGSEDLIVAENEETFRYFVRQTTAGPYPRNF